MGFTRSRRINPIVIVVIFITALGFAAYGGYKYFTKKAVYDDLVKSCTVQADAQVISCESHQVTKTKRVSKHHTKTYHETWYLTNASFMVDGKEYICKYDSKTDFPVGSMTTIKYDPNDPDKSFIGSNPQDNYSEYMKFMIVGAVLAISGIVSFIKYKGQQ